MSKFLKRNRRKSALALLLLFLQWRKGAGPMLLMVLLVMFLFVAPPNLAQWAINGIEKLPGGGIAVATLSVWASRLGINDPKDPRSLAKLLESIRASKSAESAGWALFFGSLPGQRTAKSGSIDMVRVNPDFESAREAMLRLKGGRTINGILSPEDASSGAKGVRINPDDIEGEHEGFVRAAFAGGFAPKAGNNPANSIGAYAGLGFFRAGPGAVTHDNVAAGLGGTNVPGVKGKISGRFGASARAARQGAYNRAGLRYNGRAFAQLAYGRVLSVLARPEPVCDPGMSCTPGCSVANGCPPEYASTNTGVVYDNNPTGPASGGNLTTIPQVDGVTTTGAPSDATLNQYLNEADQLVADAEACRKANEYYIGTPGNPGPETQSQLRLQQLSDQMNNANCGGGGCGGNVGKCKSLSKQMKAECRTLDGLMEAHYNACPLMQQDGPFVHANCS